MENPSAQRRLNTIRWQRLERFVTEHLERYHLTRYEHWETEALLRSANKSKALGGRLFLVLDRTWRLSSLARNPPKTGERKRLAIC